MGASVKAEHFTVSELAKVIGEKPRTIQFWAEVGVLRVASDTHRQGKGVHRRFPRGEIPYAMLAHKLASMNCPIGEIEAVVNVVRELNFSGIENSLKRMVGLLEDAQEENGPTRREIFNYVIQEIQKCLVMAACDSDVYVLIVYNAAGGAVRYGVRFWSPKTAEAAQQLGVEHNSLVDVASVGLVGYIGHKAIYFEKGEDLIMEYRGLDRRKLEEMQQGARDIAVKLLVLARIVAGA